jgi:hypothetical protein
MTGMLNLFCRCFLSMFYHIYLSVHASHFILRHIFSIQLVVEKVFQTLTLTEQNDDFSGACRSTIVHLWRRESHRKQMHVVSPSLLE